MCNKQIFLKNILRIRMETSKYQLTSLLPFNHGDVLPVIKPSDGAWEDGRGRLLEGVIHGTTVVFDHPQLQLWATEGIFEDLLDPVQGFSVILILCTYYNDNLFLGHYGTYTRSHIWIQLFV